MRIPLLRHEAKHLETPLSQLDTVGVVGSIPIAPTDFSEQTRVHRTRRDPHRCLSVVRFVVRTRGARRSGLHACSVVVLNFSGTRSPIPAGRGQRHRATTQRARAKVVRLAWAVVRPRPWYCAMPWLNAAHQACCVSRTGRTGRAPADDVMGWRDESPAPPTIEFRALWVNNEGDPLMKAPRGGDELTRFVCPVATSPVSSCTG